MIGVLEDPFATSDLINRIPTLMRRFVSRFKRNNRSNSFETLDSTMTVHGALKLLNLSTSAGSAHTCLLYTSPSPRDKRQSRMPSSA